jgi:hypothetical protein
MTSEFLFLADLLLALRLRFLLGDAAVSWRRWLTKGLIELLALALFSPHPFLLGAAATNVALNLGAAFWDRRAVERHGGRLVFGLLQLLVLSFWFSAAGGVRFRPELATWADHVRAWSAVGSDVLRLVDRQGLQVVFGLLLAANEANLVVRWLLIRLQIKPGNAVALNAGIDASEFNRGRVIGLLERALIYFFVLSGQFGAIGFTLAAKGFTRFKELENRAFAEYVLIGTLLSSSLAMAAGLWAKSLG